MWDIRHRYEHTNERLATMAADLGCCGETVRNIAKREGWVAFVAPPRDLSPAARLRVRAEQLAQAQDRHPEVRAAQPRASKGDGQGLEEFGRTSFEGGLRPPPQDDGESAEPADTAPDPAVIAAQMLHEVGGFLDDVRAERQRMKREGYAKHELQAVSRVIADLSGSLNRLKPMARHAAEPDPGIPYDDMPADLDEFRDALARRIDALLEEPPGAGDRAPAAAGGAAAAQP